MTPVALVVTRAWATVMLCFMLAACGEPSAPQSADTSAKQLVLDAHAEAESRFAANAASASARVAPSPTAAPNLEPVVLPVPEWLQGPMPKDFCITKSYGGRGGGESATLCASGQAWIQVVHGPREAVRRFHVSRKQMQRLWKTLPASEIVNRRPRPRRRPVDLPSRSARIYAGGQDLKVSIDFSLLPATVHAWLEEVQSLLPTSPVPKARKTLEAPKGRVGPDGMILNPYAR